MKRIRRAARACAITMALVIVPAIFSGKACADDNGVLNEATLKASNGEQVYQHICQGCHMPAGQGAVGAGRYPAFVDNPKLASAQYLAVTVLYGRRNMPSFRQFDGGGDDVMKAFMRSASLSDEQIAEVVNYVRTHFDNHYTDKLTAADVAALEHQ